MLINLLGPLLSSLNRNLDLLIYIRDLFFVRSFGVAHVCLSIHQNRDLLINILGPFLSRFIWGSPSLASTKSEFRLLIYILDLFLIRSCGVARFCPSLNQNRALLINSFGPCLSRFIWGSPSLAPTES